MKKILALVLVLGLMLGLCSTAFAVDLIDYKGYISRSGLTVTGAWSATCYPLDEMGGWIDMWELLPGGSWTLKESWTVPATLGTYQTHSGSITGSQGAQYKATCHYWVRDLADNSASYEKSFTLTIPKTPNITSGTCTISKSGNTLTCGATTVADITCSSIGGSFSLQSRVIGTTAWSSVGSYSHYGESDTEHFFSTQWTGMEGGFDYRIVTTHRASNAEFSDTASSTSNTVTIPYPPTTFDSAWCSVSRSGYTINTTASANMNQVCQNISIKFTLQRMNQLTGSYESISSKTMSHADDDGYAPSTSFGGSSGNQYRVKATFTVVGPDGVTVTKTSYSGSVVLY